MTCTKFPLFSPVNHPDVKHSNSWDRFYYSDSIRSNPKAIAQLVATRPEYAIRVVKAFGDKDIAQAFATHYVDHPDYWSTALAFSRDLKEGRLDRWE